MSSITTITSFPAGLGESADTLKVALKALENVDGFIRVYRGTQVEDSGVKYWISDWESAEKRVAFLSNDGHKPFFEYIVNQARESGDKEKLISLQVIFDPIQPAAAFSAPVTEIAIGTLKPGADSAKLEGYLTTITEKVKGVTGAVASAWGKSIDDSSKYVFVIGWESAEAKQAAVATAGATAGALYQDILAIADFSVKHAKLDRHDKGSA